MSGEERRRLHWKHGVYCSLHQTRAVLHPHSTRRTPALRKRDGSYLLSLVLRYQDPDRVDIRGSLCGMPSVARAHPILVQLPLPFSDIEAEPTVKDGG